MQKPGIFLYMQTQTSLRSRTPEGVASNTFFEVLLERLHMKKNEPQRLAPSL
jgi:hypothetical protein